MRLGSGRERSRCIMQFSLAAGSDRAAGGERVRAGPGWKGRSLALRGRARSVHGLSVSSGLPWDAAPWVTRQAGGAVSSFPPALAMTPGPHNPYSTLL